MNGKVTSPGYREILTNQSGTTQFLTNQNLELYTVNLKNNFKKSRDFLNNFLAAALY